MEKTRIYAQDWSKIEYQGDKTWFTSSEKIDSPLNLGLFTDLRNELRSKQYVGVMPIYDMSKSDLRDNPQVVGDVCISSRFKISPTHMIKEIVQGKDYLENKDKSKMLSYKSFSLDELIAPFKYENGEKIRRFDKVLFGYVKDCEKIDISSFGEKSKEDKSLVSGLLAETYGVFEILQFLDTLENLIKKGIKVNSITVKENLNGKVKGKILIKEHIRNNVVKGQPNKVFCGYNQISNNIIENIIIKYAIHLCMRSEIGNAFEDRLNKCYRYFEGVPLKKCTSKDFAGIKCNGVFKHYKPTLEMAKKIITRYNISYATSGKGDNKEGYAEASTKNVCPFFINMNLLFEYYCRALARKAVDKWNDEKKDTLTIKEYTSKRCHLFENKNNEHEDEDEEYINSEEYESFDANDIFGSVFMREYIPDLVIQKKEKDKLVDICVLDAKYANLSEQKAEERRSRTHQVLFYMKALNCRYGGLMSPYNGEKIKSQHKDMNNKIGELDFIIVNDNLLSFNELLARISRKNQNI